MKRPTNPTVTITVNVVSATDWTVDHAGVREELEGVLYDADICPSCEVEDGDWDTPAYVAVEGIAAQDVTVEAEVVFEGAKLTEDEQEAISEQVLAGFEWPSLTIKYHAEVEVILGGRGRRRGTKGVNYTADWTPEAEGASATYTASC